MTSLQVSRLIPSFAWGNEKILIAGPCAIESEDSLEKVATLLQKLHWKFLRGGAFKPRTSPYSFQGLGEEGLKLLNQVARKHSLYSVSEVLSPEEVSLVAEYIDILQIGSRNAQNFSLLKKVGKCQKPVLLKRGMMMRLEEFLLAAEYIAEKGNPNIILCERGIRTFETATRNTLDLSAIPYLKEHTSLPVIVDPSHATGKASYVPPLAKAALSCGADGLMIEVHPCPQNALSDGEQSLDLEQFKNLAENINTAQ
ncbi:MAG: 3-deoxy-7-phosphoheptulonate synthase [Deltaproteobacteria bacterium]|nr:3-deoxy-7-phosphoheptulonate synthase [Deltaproteobacteria bacterium]